MRMVRMMMDHPQEPAQLATRWAWMNWRERKRYLPMAPQKPNSSSGSRVIFGSAAWTALEDADGLGADVDARLGVAAGVAQGCAEDGNLDGALGG